MNSTEHPDITATPAADQHILHDGKEYTTVKEGLAHILVPASAPKTPQTAPRAENEPQSVFYNPIQQFNRDLSVLAIKAYGEEVIETKRRAKEKAKQKIASKLEKKRKREDDGVGVAPRKAGKIEDSSGTLTADETKAGEDGTEAEAKVEALKVQLHSETQVNERAEGAEEITKAHDEPTTEEQAESSAKPNSEEEPKFKKPAVPSFTILDALSATGLRALRYAHEIPFTTSVTANDLLPTATKTIELNVKHNKLENKIKANTGNAMTYMYSLVGDDVDPKGRFKPTGNKKYDVIDLDPYGTAAPFLDAAVQAVRSDGGLLCVTCTDAGVWASNGYPEKSFSLYGGIPIKGMHSHEGGLRLILHAIATSAARYGLAIEPLLSLSIDFYARVFVRIHKSAADVKFLAGKTMVVYNCDTGCGAWTTQLIAKNKLAPNKSGKGFFWKHVFGGAPTASENCVHCGKKTHLAGPMYGGPIHSPEFIKRILDDLPKVSKNTYQTTDRIEGMLTLALEETLSPPEDENSPTFPSKTGKYDPAAVDLYPFFFIPSVLAKVIHCITPHENALRGALRHLGYRVTRSHTKPGSIRTDAPWSVIWEVMREWARQKAPVREGAIKKDTAGWAIMFGDGPVKNTKGAEKPQNGTTEGKPKIEVVFDEKLGREVDVKKLVRYQVNPRENWGPMNRAKGAGDEKEVEKE
jgi:tRNA (guanine26-N2/guanine27-N2)-dimethyltransferase